MPPSLVDSISPSGWPTSLAARVLGGAKIVDPSCSNYTCKSSLDVFTGRKRRTPELDYGEWTVWYYSFWILLFAAFYVFRLLLDRLWRPKRLKNQRPSLRHKAVALVRFLVYRRPDNRFMRSITLHRISYGTLALLTLSAIFFAILPWPQQPYLRPHSGSSSPPLSVRCAVIILALTPLTVALAGKVNVISWLTGIGYEQLNVFHRYISYLIYCLATIHTIPRLIGPVQDGGWSRLNKLYANAERELSGTLLYSAIFGLTFFSIPWIRKRTYEAFKYIHIFLGVSYIGLFWWHIWEMYMSPYYLYATIAVLCVPNLIRLIHRYYNLRSLSNFNGFPTTLKPLQGNMTKVTIEVPRSLKWKPGQHALLRMPKISVVGNHPFYITNVPSPDKGRNAHEMMFLIRHRHGFTEKLFEYTQRLAYEAEASALDIDLRINNNIGKEKSGMVGVGKGISIEKEKGTEYIEDIDAITSLDTTTVLEQEIFSPKPQASSSAWPLAFGPPPKPTLKHQTSNSSFPPRDEFTEAKMLAIAKKPAGIRTASLLSSHPNHPASSRETPLDPFRISTSTNRRSSVSSFPPIDEFTSAALLAISQKRGPQSLLRTLVDGPYGTHYRPLHRIYDTILCVAGGTGIAALIPHILDLTQRLRYQKKDEILATRRIHLMWIIRDAECISWVERELSTAIRNIREHPSPNACNFTVDVFVTGSTVLVESASFIGDEGPLSPVSLCDEEAMDNGFHSLHNPEKGVASLPSRPKPTLRNLNGGKGLFEEEANVGIERGTGLGSGVSVATHYCRPVIKDLVEGYIGGDRAIIMGSGPPSLSAELANVTASFQRRVWRGEMREVKLEIKTFGS